MAKFKNGRHFMVEVKGEKISISVGDPSYGVGLNMKKEQAITIRDEIDIAIEQVIQNEIKRGIT